METIKIKITEEEYWPFLCMEKADTQKNEEGISVSLKTFKHLKAAVKKADALQKELGKLLDKHLEEKKLITQLRPR